MNGISPQLQNQITQFQQVQQQLQAVTTQKMQYDAQKRELARTLEELTASTGAVYKSSGSLLIKVEDKEALKGELEESVEMMDVRISSLERQESSLKERYQSLQETINAAMGNMPRQCSTHPCPLPGIRHPSYSLGILNLFLRRLSLPPPP